MTRYTRPIIPSVPVNPEEEDATPIDWDEMTRADESVTLSVHSVPIG